MAEQRAARPHPAARRPLPLAPPRRPPRACWTNRSRAGASRRCSFATALSSSPQRLVGEKHLKLRLREVPAGGSCATRSGRPHRAPARPGHLAYRLSLPTNGRVNRRWEYVIEGASAEHQTVTATPRHGPERRPPLPLHRLRRHANPRALAAAPRRAVCSAWALTDHEIAGQGVPARPRWPRDGLPDRHRISVTFAGRVVHIVGLALTTATSSSSTACAPHAAAARCAREMAAGPAEVGIPGAYEGALTLRGATRS